MAVKWSKKYEIGMRDIDEQHKTLIEAFDKFMSSVQRGDSKKRIIELLDFLENYTHEHFRREEAYQIKYNYPEFPRHKAIHDSFKAKLKNFRNEVQSNKSPLSLALSIQRELVDWILNHIKESDRKLGLFLANK